MKCQSEYDTYGDGKMRLFMTGMAALLISGCNADMQQLARASCALTTECYAPGVAPGTNPYRAQPTTQTINQSGLLHRNTGTWLDRGNRMCSYSDGTIINIGGGICPINRP